MGQAVQPALAGNQVHHERRPEEATLYQVVQEHLETFLAQVEAETGASLPDFVKDEFDAFLECGILAHGFVRLRCARVARMRSWWPSPASDAGFAPPAGRGAWRESTAHLVDCVIPRVPVRQWVLSFPIPLRILILFAAHPDLLTGVAVHSPRHCHLSDQAGGAET